MNYLYLLFVASVISGIAGILYYYYFYDGQMTADKLIRTLMIFMLPVMGAFCVGFIIAEIIRLVRVDKLERFLLKNGYCDEYYKKIRRFVGKKNSVKKTEGLIFLAKELADGERYDEAVETIKSVELSYLRGGLTKEYYATYLYILVMNGELENAEIVAAAGADYLEGDSFATMSLGISDYAKGNFSDAEERLMSSAMKADSDFTECYSKMFLALVYVKTDRKELAKELAAKLISVVTNPRQKKDLKKLMLIIEREYGFERAVKEPESDNLESDIKNTDI